MCTKYTCKFIAYSCKFYTHVCKKIGKPTAQLKTISDHHQVHMSPVKSLMKTNHHCLARYDDV